ncbi:MAG: DJ-1 family glyoxalase III [Paludibacter sp.]
MTIYLFLAEGFEEIEAIAPIDIFRRAGIEVITVSISENKAVCGAHGITVMADVCFHETNFSSDSLLFLPGGLPGTYNLALHEGLNSLIKKHADANKDIAAICAAPSIFGQLGLLKGKEAVCYPGFEDKLLDATVSNEMQAQSGNVFTAKAAGVAMEFALTLVTKIKGAEVANSIRNGMFI